MEIEHPRISFTVEGAEEREFFGFLSIVDGLPYLAPSIETAKSQKPYSMLRLDPLHLLGSENFAEFQSFFLYSQPIERRAMLPGFQPVQP